MGTGKAGQQDVILDVDDVVVDLGASIYRTLNAMTGKRLGPEHVTDYYALAAIYGLSNDEMLEALRHERLLEEAAPMPGALKAIEALRAGGNRVHLCTARGFHPRGEAITREWLEAYRVRVDGLMVVPWGERKSTTYRAAGRQFSLIVDDNDHHIDDARESGVVERVALIDMPYNRHRHEYRHGRERFASLAEVADAYLARIGVVEPTPAIDIAGVSP
ncbi:phosphoglycolate phosphatase-like HAD superfamily hydrolase [Natronocella acetinitrilica]|uniref:Phosphoglycolate phosphatase-like HAD superfamily hydrolase n=1 Tax=Natronocella acetinitrilica TaxID=414046 RepID=A0AAE3G248_9GAMM|nr:hypothetical protein [Natronocella acetinitrilica]MCP1674199.1 phosphoglycolate phosphatase-like HAD superfamily hydrolase [Natronocella acetinitrilica]